MQIRLECMNRIRLKGVIRDIEYSHTIGDVDYDKANIIVTRKDGKEDILSLRFKKFSNPYQNNQICSLVGNVRSYSKKISENKNKVELYVFTYFDIPDLNENDQEVINEFELDGRICKIDELRTTRDGKQNIHFILANNLIFDNNNQKLNSYIPIIAWGPIAKMVSELNVNDRINVIGELHSREYRKTFEDGSYEIRVAHEGVANYIEVK